MTGPAQPPPEQPPVVGYTPEQLEAAALPLEAATVAALIAAAAAAARLITAPAGAPAGVAGAAFVTLDDLAVITRLWVQHTDRQLMPILRNVFHESADHVHGQIGKLLAGITELPPGVTELPAEPGLIPDTYAEDLMAAARNRLVGIGDVLWANARQQLAEGMREGESIPQLAARVRAAAGVSEPRATVIARTEVISTSNGASIAQARSAGVPLEKQWMATDDTRTRPTHVVADGQVQPMGEPFIVGGAPLDFPGDPAGPPGQVINCRCSIGFHLASDITTAAARVRKLEGEALANFNRKHPRGFGGKFGAGGREAFPQLRRVSLNSFVQFHGGEKQRRQLSTGDNASVVHLVTFNDGTKAVEKYSKSDTDTARHEFDAEQLGALVAESIGLKPPKVTRTDEDKAYFEYVTSGRVAAELPEFGWGSSSIFTGPYADSPDGRRMGLLDTLIENTDRNAGNWFIQDDGSLTPIDHGAGWAVAQDKFIAEEFSADQPLTLGGFTDRYLTGAGFEGEWVDNDLSPAYTARLSNKLQALRPAFEQLGRMDLFGRMMIRMGIISDHAKGTVNL